MRPAWLALVLLTGCWSGAPTAPSTITNTTPAVDTLRIPRVPPRVGSVRIETTRSEGWDRDYHKVVRVEVLAVEGIATTREKVTYVEATGSLAALAGKTYEVASGGNGLIDVSPGGPEEDLVRKDNESIGKPDSTMLMVTEREFRLGASAQVKPPGSLPRETKVTLTLRSFDEDTATFDIALLLDADIKMRAQGSLTVERATGLDSRASLDLELKTPGKLEHASLQFSANSE